jgi:hypothetical protein
MEREREMGRIRHDLTIQLQEFCELNELKVCWCVKAKTQAIAEHIKVDPNECLFEFADDSQNFWSDLFSAPKDVDSYVTNFYATKTVQMMRSILGPDLFLEMKLPPQVNKENPRVTSVTIDRSKEVEIKLAENFIQTGKVVPKFATNVNDGDVYLALIGPNGDREKLDVFCILNISVKQWVDFLDVLLPIYINLLARKPSAPGDSRIISGSKCWEFFSGLLSAIEYPPDMKISVPNLHLLIDAGLLTANTTHTKCIGLASDEKSFPFWRSRPGAKPTNEYDSIMNTTELRSAMAAGGGGFEIELNPQRSLAELTAANDLTKTTALAGAVAAAPVEDTRCVGGSQDKLIVTRRTLLGLSQNIEDDAVQQHLSQVIEAKIRNSQGDDLSKLQSLHEKLTTASQQTSKRIPHISSSIQQSASSARNPFEVRYRDSNELAAENAEKYEAVLAKHKPKSEKEKDLDRVKRKLDQYQDQEQNKNKHQRDDDYDYDYGWIYNEDPDKGSQFPDEGTQLPLDRYGGRRPRRQRRKTKRNNKQTKRRKQKTNKRVNKRQTKRIKKRRTKKI